eukprot:3137893-Amphidinium_carterae.1
MGDMNKDLFNHLGFTHSYKEDDAAWALNALKTAFASRGIVDYGLWMYAAACEVMRSAAAELPGSPFANDARVGNHGADVQGCECDQRARLSEHRARSATR